MFLLFKKLLAFTYIHTPQYGNRYTDILANQYDVDEDIQGSQNHHLRAPPHAMVCQVHGVDPQLLQAAGDRIKLGEVMGSGPGYFKLTPSPLAGTVAECALTAAGEGAGGRLPSQRTLVVAFGSAPGHPNWGGLLGRLYKAANDDAQK